MSEMSNKNSENNGINRPGPVGEGSSPGRCFLVRKQRPGRHPTTVRTKWSKNVNKIVISCFFRSKPFDDDGKSIRGYRQQMMQEWKKSLKSPSKDCVRAIRKNGWLSDLELENIQRMVEAEIEIVNESIEDVKENQTEKNIVRTRKKISRLVMIRMKQ